MQRKLSPSRGLILFSIAIILANFIMLTHIFTVAAQSGSGIAPGEAQIHLDMGKVYEDQGEWDLAIEEYKVAASSTDPTQAADARTRIQNVLQKKNSLLFQVQKDAGNFAVWLLTSVIKVLLVLGLLYVVIRLGLNAFTRRDTLTIVPFKDLTGHKLGEILPEMLVGLIEEMRTVHLNSENNIIIASENVDLPSISSADRQNQLLASLTAMDAFDVSGLSLPIGSALTALARWLGTGQKHISGSIYQVGDELHIAAQMHEGRSSKTGKTWHVQTQVAQQDIDKNIHSLQQRLAFSILFDLTSNWEASSPESLQMCTIGLQKMQLYKKLPVGNRGMLEEAIESFQNALRVDPGYITAHYNLAAAYHNLGCYDEAIKTLKTVRALPRHNVLEVAYSLGIAYYHLLKPWAYDQAEKEFSTVIQYCSPEENSELYSLACCGLLGVSAQKMHLDNSQQEEHFRKAIGYFQEVVETPQNKPLITAIACSSMATAYLNHNEPDQALELFEKSVLQAPQYWSTYLHWGRALMAKNNHETAVEVLRQAVALNPRYEFAYYQLGIAYKNLEKFEEALEAFASANSIAQAHDERGTILAENYRQYEQALGEFEEALKIKPKLSNALVNVAWYTLESGEQDPFALQYALDCARQAVEIEKGTPKEAHRHSILGRVFLVLGQLDQACEELHQSASLRKSERLLPQTDYYLAQVYYQKCEYEKAADALKTFLKHKSNSAWYRQNYESAVAQLKEITELQNRLEKP